ncbi:DUF1592 domain-containing protein [Tautonia marina]|uniref:DUF1592 domain-containing protein n=1 Tax=Tautonia marina TaxID=2653855 RepID=UPI0013759519|nr:DUF1592 domain-containing protein [Tautonia marina]
MSLNRIRAVVGHAAGRGLPALVLVFGAGPVIAEASADDRFDEVIRPILEDNCYACHALGVNKGNVDLEALADAEDGSQPEVRDAWLAVLKNVQAEIMPPSDHPQPSDEERKLLLDWITFDAFGLDPDHPDPGRVTVRRLNRTEYRNTIRDLMGVDFNAEAEFPADDTGHGFDTIADVLTISPLLMERYIAAAQDIVGRADPIITGPVPDDPVERCRSTRDLLGRFATRAFRRPVGDETADRLTDLALTIAAEPGATYEAGVSQAMVAVLASPRFLFREEGIEPGDRGPHPRIDEYALASRLSYLLWSTMPDDELFALADRGELRANLMQQVERMMEDERSNQFVRNFVGQWLQVRNIDSIPVNAFAVLSRDEPPDPEAEARRERFRELRRKPIEDLTDAEKTELDEVREQFGRARDRFRQFELDRGLRIAMRRETELLVETIIQEDRSLIELLDSDYTFLNERLARHYGIEGVEGNEMRRVDLPPDSPRGGILTQGTILAVTSNPDRTSPVKRGLFILENILGTPPAPPPPNIPSLEEAGKDLGGRVPSVREAMELHRSDPLCNSCHNRMDPLGLALENFNALGMYREVERTGPIDSSGVLITGEPFQSVQDLKRILAEDRRRDFYRCLVEKMLTYAVGRGLEYHDVQTVETLVDRLEANDGRASELILGIIESAPFQRRRGPEGQTTVERSDPADRNLGTD